MRMTVKAPDGLWNEGWLTSWRLSPSRPRHSKGGGQSRQWHHETGGESRKTNPTFFKPFLISSDAPFISPFQDIFQKLFQVQSRLTGHHEIVQPGRVKMGGHYISIKFVGPFKIKSAFCIYFSVPNQIMRKCVLITTAGHLHADEMHPYFCAAGLSERRCPEQAVQEGYAAQNVLFGTEKKKSFLYDLFSTRSTLIHMHHPVCFFPYKAQISVAIKCLKCFKLKCKCKVRFICFHRYSARELTEICFRCFLFSLMTRCCTPFRSSQASSS